MNHYKKINELISKILKKSKKISVKDDYVCFEYIKFKINFSNTLPQIKEYLENYMKIDIQIDNDLKTLREVFGNINYEVDHYNRYLYVFIEETDDNFWKLYMGYGWNDLNIIKKTYRITAKEHIPILSNNINIETNDIYELIDKYKKIKEEINIFKNLISVQYAKYNFVYCLIHNEDKYYFNILNIINNIDISIYKKDKPISIDSCSYKDYVTSYPHLFKNYDNVKKIMTKSAKNI